MQSTEHKPLACTLEREALTPRLAEMRAFTTANLLSHEFAGGVVRLRYRREAAPQLRRIVELEQVFCAFLHFEVNETPSDVHLTITAPSQAGETAGWLFAQFLPEAPPPPSIASCSYSRRSECC